MFCRKVQCESKLNVAAPDLQNPRDDNVLCLVKVEDRRTAELLRRQCSELWPKLQPSFASEEVGRRAKRLTLRKKKKSFYGFTQITA